jgi:hypothetical protein
MLDAGLALLDGQLGVTFTVDGDPTIRRALRDGFVRGNVLTDNGVVQKRGATLTFHPTTWTPEVGKRVTVRGHTFVVDGIGETDSHTVVTLVESHVP